MRETTTKLREEAGDTLAGGGLPAVAGRRGLPSRPGGGVLANLAPSRSWLKAKHVLFALCVLLPSLVSAVYFYGFASDQYVAESRFGIRSADMLRNDATGMFQGMAAASTIGLESNVMVQYSQSREIVDALQKSVDLRGIYAAPQIDWLSRLDPASGAEDVVGYWRGKIDPFFDLTTGSISLRIKAFTRAEALALNEEVLRLSEALVNDISIRARTDTVKHAQDEVAHAEARLQKARQALLEFRNKERSIDPKKQADSLLALAGKLREDLARVSAEVSYAKSYLPEKAPQIVQGRNRIRSLQEQIDAAERQLTGAAGSEAGGDTLSRTVGGFDTLETERVFAEKSYNTALESLQKAQAAADRQAIYFSVFVRPALPDRSLYPRRLESVGLTVLAGLGGWILLMIGFYSMREHV